MPSRVAEHAFDVTSHYPPALWLYGEWLDGGEAAPRMDTSTRNLGIGELPPKPKFNLDCAAHLHLIVLQNRKKMHCSAKVTLTRDFLTS